MRQIVLDTETTGLEPQQDHRIIEIGCVELVNRRPTGRHFHRYLNPGREIDEGAAQVHGLTLSELADKPRFEEIAAEFVDFVRDAELIIHNAEFDVGFLNHELTRIGFDPADLNTVCRVLDTLHLARSLHPGQRNGLDALCKRYAVDNSERELHGALLDAQLLAEVYLAMTGGQAALSLSGDEPGTQRWRPGAERIEREGLVLVVQQPSAEDLAAHESLLDFLQEQGGRPPLWRA